jgi:hypothetical protein
MLLHAVLNRIVCMSRLVGDRIGFPEPSRYAAVLNGFDVPYCCFRSGCASRGLRHNYDQASVASKLFQEHP